MEDRRMDRQRTQLQPPVDRDSRRWGRMDSENRVHGARLRCSWAVSLRRFSAVGMSWLGGQIEIA